MPPPEHPVTTDEPSLRDVLGGREAALDASAPVAAFAVAWLLADRAARADAVLWGAGAALAAAVLVGGVRLARGGRPRAVVVGLFGVAVAATVALYTGRAVDFFLVQLLSNAVSALAWAVSILVRWPLLGLVVGTALGQGTRWRRDPDLLRGYQRASWIWVAQYVLRLAVFVPLWAAGAVVALSAARLALTWPLIALCIGASWPALRSALPAGHRGLRYPRDPTDHSQE